MTLYRVNWYFRKADDKADQETTVNTASDAATRVRQGLARDAKMVTVMAEDEAAA